VQQLRRTHSTIGLDLRPGSPAAQQGRSRFTGDCRNAVLRHSGSASATAASPASSWYRPVSGAKNAGIGASGRHNHSSTEADSGKPCQTRCRHRLNTAEPPSRRCRICRLDASSPIGSAAPASRMRVRSADVSSMRTDFLALIRSFSG
jgi:hypothetical protein